MSKLEVRDSDSSVGGPADDCGRGPAARLSPISRMGRAEIQADLAPPQTEGDRVGAVARPELLKHVAHVRLHGRAGDAELHGDPRRAPAFGHHPENLALALGE